MDLRPGYKQTEIGLIPEDWDAVPLGDLFTFKNGLNKAKKYFGYGTPIVNYMDVFRHRGLRLDRIEGRVDVSNSELEAFEVRRGDVFFTRTSETVEEIGVAAAMLDPAHDTVFSGFVLRARPTGDRLDDLFKAYCFSPRYFRQQVIARATYTTRALTNGRSLSAAILAVPPVTEQKGIAEALSDIDAAITNYAALIVKKRDIRAGAMRRLIAGEARLPGFSKPWIEKRLGDLATLYQPETISQSVFKKTGYPVFGANGVVGHFDRFNHSTPQLMISCRGNCGTVNRSDGPAWITGNAMVVNIEQRRDLVDFDFLYFLLSNTDFSLVTTGSGQPQIVRGPLSEILLKMPSGVDEQISIARILTDMDEEITALEARLEKTRALKQGMMQALLTGRVRLPVKGETLDALELAHA